MAKFLSWLTFILLFLGGLNWLFVAWGFNAVEEIFSNDTAANVVYWLVGLSAIYQLLLKVFSKNK